MKKSLLIILTLLLMFVFNGCSESDSSAEDAVATDVNVSQDKSETEEYVNTAVETTLFSGEWTVGEDIQPGKYIFTVASGVGNFFIYDEDGNPYINDILCAAGKEEDSFGVSKIVSYLTEGETIEISGLNDVKCSPAPIELSKDLCTGIHFVGYDIEPGSYIVTTDAGSGNLFVYDEDGYPVTNEILCVAGEEDSSLGVSKVKVSLKNDYMIQVSGLNNVHFE